MNHHQKPERQSVLIIEDTAQTQAQTLLDHRDDLRILRADNAEDALSILVYNQVNLTLIVHDSAIALCREIRDCDLIADVPILLVCANDADAQTAAYEAGADGLVVEPIHDSLAQAQIDTVLRLDRFAQRREISEKLEYAAAELSTLKECDPTTGLPNSLMFESSVEQELARALRSDYALGVLVVEFSNYDSLSSVYDQAALDKLTRAMADRLSSAVRGRAVIGRLDTRCLAICQPLPRAAELTRAVHKYRRALVDPYMIGDQPIEIDCSIGASVSPNDADDAGRLVGLASSAMAHARHLGRNKYHLFAPAARADAKRRLELESRIRRAIEADGMLLHYQPRLKLSDGAVMGVEALLRLRGEDGELLSPHAFLPVAEDSGMMEELGMWAIQRACQDAASLRREGLDVRISVNVAGDLFAKDTFYDELCDTIDHFELDGESLELEVSERAIAPQLHGTLYDLQTLIEKLQRKGVGLSLDNFGAGLTCLNELRHLALDNIKLSQDLITAVPEDERMTHIVANLIKLIESLGMRVIAQGVEHEVQMETLRDMGCDDAQGFLFAKPMPFNELLPMLHSLIATWNNVYGNQVSARAS